MTSAPRPTVTLKIATSLDGRIATASGESKWITGEAARQEVHRLRAAHDAVLVGSQTVIDDDPELTVRLPGYAGPQPLRVVADGRLRTPLASKLLRSAALQGGSRSAPVCIVTLPVNSAGPTSDPFTNTGAFVSFAPGSSEGGLAAEAIVQAIHQTLAYSSDAPWKGVAKHILLEGGGKLAASFLRAGLIDRIEWFRAPILLGGDAKPALAALELERLADAPRFKRLDVRSVGDDLWERYERLP